MRDNAVLPNDSEAEATREMLRIKEVMSLTRLINGRDAVFSTFLA